MKRRFLLKSVLFLIILLTPVLWISKYDNLLLDPTNTNFARILNAHNFDSLDYLVIGNSHGYSSVYPPLFDSLEIAIYNYGIPGAGVYYYQMMVADYLSFSRKNPAKILIAVSPSIFSSTSDEWDIASYHRYFISPLTHEQILLEYDFDLEKYLKATQSSFVRGLLWMRSRQQTDRSQLIAESEDYKGFYHRYDTFSVKVYEQHKALYEKTFGDKFQSEKESELLALLNLIKMKNIEPILFEIPRNRLDDFFSKDYLKTYNAFLENVESKGVKLFRNDWEPDSTRYRDIDHLNLLGAKEFTYRLIKKLHN